MSQPTYPPAHPVHAYSQTYTKSPAETKTAELASQEAARNNYQRAARNASRDYAALTGQPDGFIPVLTSINPSTKVSGSGSFTLTCTGSNFNEDSKVYWNGYLCEPTTVSPTVITVAISSGVISVPGTAQVTVKTDSSVSAAKPFTIT